jgi:hypothetical protein
VFPFAVFILLPNILTSSAETRSLCAPFNSNHFGLSWSFLIAYFKQSWKVMAIKHLLVSDHSDRKCIRQIFTYAKFAIGFIYTHFN